MSNTPVKSVLWWIVGLSAPHITQAANNYTSDSDLGGEISSGKVTAITLGSLCAVIVALAVTAGCLSCCSTKKIKTTRTNPDGSNETTETEERGSQEVAGRIVGVASSVVDEMGEVLAAVTHTTVTTADVRPSPASFPNSGRTNNASTTTIATTVDSKTVLLAIKADIADGSSDGNKVAAAAQEVLETEAAVARGKFLIAESAKLQQDAAAPHTSIDIHPVDMQVAGATSHLPADHQ